MEKNNGLENDVVNLYKQFDASVYRADVMRKDEEIIKSKNEIKEILEEFSMNVYSENPNGFYDAASKIPGVGKYVKGVMVKRNGNIAERKIEKQKKMLSKMEEFLTEAGNKRADAFGKINELLDLKKYAAEQMEKNEMESEDYRIKVENAQNAYNSMTRREKISSEGVEIQKTFMLYQNQLEEAEMNINRNASIVKNSEVLITAYKVHSENIKKYLVASSEVYNDISFTVNNLDKADLNLTKLKEDMTQFLNADLSYKSLKRIVNYVGVSMTDMTNSYVRSLESYDRTLLNGNSLTAMTKNIKDSGEIVDKMVNRNRQIAKMILYGNEEKRA